VEDHDCRVLAQLAAHYQLRVLAQSKQPIVKAMDRPGRAPADVVGIEVNDSHVKLAAASLRDPEESF
jgi:4'-phosphopantetheinyl transferase EntD